MAKRIEILCVIFQVGERLFVIDLHGSGYLKSLHRWQRRQNSKYVGLKMQRTGSQGLEADPSAG